MSLLHLLVSLLSLGTMFHFPSQTAVVVAHWDSLLLPAGAVELQTSDTTPELWRNQTFTDGNCKFFHLLKIIHQHVDVFGGECLLNDREAFSSTV